MQQFLWNQYAAGLEGLSVGCTSCCTPWYHMHPVPVHDTVLATGLRGEVGLWCSCSLPVPSPTMTIKPADVAASFTCCVVPPQAMRVMNKRMNLPNMQKILMEFEKQNERMEMTSDMMGDAIDDAMEVGAGGWGGGGRGMRMGWRLMGVCGRREGAGGDGTWLW